MQYWLIWDFRAVLVDTGLLEATLVTCVDGHLSL